MINNYEDVKDRLMFRQNYVCPVCLCGLYKYNEHIDLHHLMRNTKGNRKRYPLLINHELNLVAVHNSCHIAHHGSCGSMSDIEAEKLEAKLRGNI